MSSVLFWVALVTLILTVLAAVDLLIGNRSVPALRDVSPEAAGDPPRVSLIVAARNEERHIRAAVESMLGLSYPNYEIIAVDDRSDDQTGALLNELARRHTRLKVIHIDALPAGWLGKNHALWVGSQRATGEIFLFTDADIYMEKTVLTRAVAFLKERRLGHLAVTPSLQMPTLFLSMFGAAFAIYFSLFSRPWKAKDPNSRSHIGIGAFNMVTAEAYQRVEGHQAIRLRPDDDIKLGKVLKLAGFRADVAYAPEYLSVEWYDSLRAVVKGLEKNAFSGADYSIPLVLAGVVFHTLCSIWPFVAVWVTTGYVQWINLAVVALIMLAAADTARFHGSRPWYAIGYPVTSAFFVYILLRTMTLNLIQGGIYWRGTFYSLKELRANRV
ncbi:glycosyltransferase [Geomonas sp. Red32]|uniref:glycosyltransferase n=1 Tax=Geomonas sp. Red32 TaxID=2912856 RepID=UPI00202CAB27|nr:glycosyltransferase [Geomonas sp. Red32]MCM0084264.1 glycosyltransferase [Geomonas sp. Red32]